MLVTQISIDLSGLSRYEYVIAKQADENSRLIQVQLLDNGKIYVLDDLTTARVSITKPDKKEVLKDCTINNNMVEIALDANILAVAGTAEAEIILTGSGGAITSAAFDIKITATVTGKKAGSSNDYESFKAALAAADAFKNEINGKATKEELAVERARIDNLLLDSTVNLSGYELIEIYANSDYSGSTVLEDIWSTSMLLSTTAQDEVDWSHAADVKIINVGAINWNEGASYPDPEMYKKLPYHMDDVSAAIEMIDDAYAVRIMADDATKTYSRLYVKIVLAYKSHLSIPELEDLKVGADGMIYDSAGAAVRAQVQQIQSNKEEISKLSKEIETLNQGGLNLKEDFIGEQVNSWFDEHPEASSTVQDSSIGNSKLTSKLRENISRINIPIGITIPQSPSENYEQWTIERIKETIDNVREYGYKNIYIRNEETYTDLEGWAFHYPISDMVNALKYLNELGLTASIRIFTPSKFDSYRNNEWEIWHETQINNLISEIQNDGIIIDNFGNFNENTTIINNHSDFVVRVLNSMGTVGRAGITCQGFVSAFNVPESVTSVCDWLGVNVYPRVGVGYKKGNQQLTVSDIASGISSYNLDARRKTLESKVSLPILVTEIGTTKYWEGYDYPEFTSYSEDGYNFIGDESGEPNARYFEGVLFALKDSGFKEIDVWYNGESQKFGEMLKRWVI